MFVPHHGARYQPGVLLLWLIGGPIVRFDEIGLFYGRARARALIFDSLILDFVSTTYRRYDTGATDEIRRWK